MGAVPVIQSFFSSSDIVERKTQSYYLGSHCQTNWLLTWVELVNHKQYCYMAHLKEQFFTRKKQDQVALLYPPNF